MVHAYHQLNNQTFPTTKIIGIVLLRNRTNQPIPRTIHGIPQTFHSLTRSHSIIPTEAKTSGSCQCRNIPTLTFRRTSLLSRGRGPRWGQGRDPSWQWLKVPCLPRGLTANHGQVRAVKHHGFSKSIEDFRFGVFHFGIGFRCS